MSINSKQTLPCPKCGQQNDVTIWNMITAHDSPDLKKDLLSGRVNFFVCGSCGYRALMPNALLYHDIDKKLLFSFSPCDDPAEAQELFEKVIETSEESGELKKLEGYNLRFITNINDLMEKIITFDAELNDKVVEVIKIMILSQDPDTAGQRECRLGKKDGDELEFMVRDRKEEKIYTCRVPMATYDTVHKQVMESGVKPYSFNWEMVNNFYASRILNGFNNIQR